MSKQIENRDILMLFITKDIKSDFANMEMDI